MLKFYYNGEDLLDDAAQYWNKELTIVSCLSASMTLIKKWGIPAR